VGGLVAWEDRAILGDAIRAPRRHRIEIGSGAAIDGVGSRGSPRRGCAARPRLDAAQARLDACGRLVRRWDRRDRARRESPSQRSRIDHAAAPAAREGCVGFLSISSQPVSVMGARSRKMVLHHLAPVPFPSRSQAADAKTSIRIMPPLLSPGAPLAHIRFDLGDRSR